MKKTALFCCITAMAFLLSACNEDPASNPANPNNSSAVEKDQRNSQEIIQPINGIVNYGAGVYYFAYTRASFAKVLVFFLRKYPNMEVVSIAPDVARMNCGKVSSAVFGTESDYGAAVGYFVIFRDKTGERLK